MDKQCKTIPEKHARNRKSGSKAARTPDSEPKKKFGRDDKGRWLTGESGNARGRPPITPEMKMVRSLCEVEREANVAELVRLRNSADDPWVRIEAIKILLQYSDGKPVTAHTGAPLVNMNFGMPAGTADLSPADAYRMMILGAITADPEHPSFRPSIEHTPKDPK